MGLKYLTEKAYETLLDNINVDQEKYLETDVWLPDYFKDKEYFKESRIVAGGNGLSLYMEGDKNASDLINVRTVFDNLGNLTPQQASNPYIWTYLSLVDCWRYSRWRWGKSIEELDAQEGEDVEVEDQLEAKESKRSTNIKQRYLCRPSRIGLLRNSISRLWWYGYLSFKKGPVSHKYELTELLLSQSDLCQSIVERNFSMNRNVCFGILSAIKKINDDESLTNVIMSEWRSLCKHINRYGAVTLLDTLSEEDVEKLSYKYILNLRK